MSAWSITLNSSVDRIRSSAFFWSAFVRNLCMGSSTLGCSLEKGAGCEWTIWKIVLMSPSPGNGWRRCVSSYRITPRAHRSDRPSTLPGVVICSGDM